jgi:TetR/AcrR family transcriptional regulator, cholesterol catabolism regulator
LPLGQTSVRLVDFGVVKVPAPPARKDQILEAAARLFGERGYHGTSMRDLAEETGILPGSLYAHIQSKEGLLYEIVARAAGEFLERLEAVRAAEVPPEERLRLAMRVHVGVVAEHLDGARVFLHEWRALEPGRREEVRGLRRRYEGLWDGIVRDLHGAADRKFARLLVLSAANWTYAWYDPEGPLSPEEVADRLTDLLLGGLERSGKISIGTTGEVRS